MERSQVAQRSRARPERHLSGAGKGAAGPGTGTGSDTGIVVVVLSAMRLTNSSVIQTKRGVKQHYFINWYNGAPGNTSLSDQRNLGARNVSAKCGDKRLGGVYKDIDGLHQHCLDSLLG